MVSAELTTQPPQISTAAKFAAKTTPGCPIYGMPILDVQQSANIIFLKRSMRPGFAGIENELLYDPKTTLLFGDAKASLTKVVSSLKAL